MKKYIIFISLFLISCSNPITPISYNVSGKVILEGLTTMPGSVKLPDEPIKNETIYCVIGKDTLNTITDENGNFTFNLPENTEFYLMVKSIHFYFPIEKTKSYILNNDINLKTCFIAINYR